MLTVLFFFGPGSVSELRLVASERAPELATSTCLMAPRTFARIHYLQLSREEKKAYTTTTERKSFGELFWSQRKTFQAGGGYKNPMKTRKTISTTEIFPLWPPFFFRQRKVLHWSRAVCAFFFPALTHAKKKTERTAQLFATEGSTRRTPHAGHFSC